MPIQRKKIARTPKATNGGREIPSAVYGLHFFLWPVQISRTTGMIMGRLPVAFWIRRFNSARTFSLTIP